MRRGALVPLSMQLFIALIFAPLVCASSVRPSAASGTLLPRQQEVSYLDVNYIVHLDTHTNTHTQTEAYTNDNDGSGLKGESKNLIASLRPSSADGDVRAGEGDTEEEPGAHGDDQVQARQLQKSYLDVNYLINTDVHAKTFAAVFPHIPYTDDDGSIHARQVEKSYLDVNYLVRTGPTEFKTLAAVFPHIPHMNEDGVIVERQVEKSYLDVNYLVNTAEYPQTGERVRTLAAVFPHIPHVRYSGDEQNGDQATESVQVDQSLLQLNRILLPQTLAAVFPHVPYKDSDGFIHGRQVAKSYLDVNYLVNTNGGVDHIRTLAAVFPHIPHYNNDGSVGVRADADAFNIGIPAPQPPALPPPPPAQSPPPAPAPSPVPAPTTAPNPNQVPFDPNANPTTNQAPQGDPKLAVSSSVAFSTSSPALTASSTSTTDTTSSSSSSSSSTPAPTSSQAQTHSHSMLPPFNVLYLIPVFALIGVIGILAALWLLYGCFTRRPRVWGDPTTVYAYARSGSARRRGRRERGWEMWDGGESAEGKGYGYGEEGELVCGPPYIGIGEAERGEKEWCGEAERGREAFAWPGGGGGRRGRGACEDDPFVVQPPGLSYHGQGGVRAGARPKPLTRPTNRSAKTVWTQASASRSHSPAWSQSDTTSLGLLGYYRDGGGDDDGYGSGSDEENGGGKRSDENAVRRAAVGKEEGEEEVPWESLRHKSIKRGILAEVVKEGKWLDSLRGRVPPPLEDNGNTSGDDVGNDGEADVSRGEGSGRKGSGEGIERRHRHVRADSDVCIADIVAGAQDQVSRPERATLRGRGREVESPSRAPSMRSRVGVGAQEDDERDGDDESRWAKGSGFRIVMESPAPAPASPKEAKDRYTRMPSRTGGSPSQSRMQSPVGSPARRGGRGGGTQVGGHMRGGRGNTAARKRAAVLPLSPSQILSPPLESQLCFTPTITLTPASAAAPTHPVRPLATTSRGARRGRVLTQALMKSRAAHNRLDNQSLQVGAGAAGQTHRVRTGGTVGRDGSLIPVWTGIDLEAGENIALKKVEEIMERSWSVRELGTGEV